MNMSLGPILMWHHVKKSLRAAVVRARSRAPAHERRSACLVTALLSCLCTVAVAEPPPAVRDDLGHTVRLVAPAHRIISLAPHTTELLFAAGANDQVVAVSRYSDYPEQARHLPQIGDALQLDLEGIVALKPDLIVIWGSGTPARQQAQIQKLGIPLFFSEPKKLEDIGSSVLRLGQLMATQDKARVVADELAKKVAQLRNTYQKRRTLRVFYQISDKPIYTLNGQHIVSDALALCGARNVFADLSVVAPNVSLEAVLQQNPEVILGSETNVASWRQFPALVAVQRHNLFNIDGNILTRSGPRMIDGVRDLCVQLDLARRMPAP